MPRYLKERITVTCPSTTATFIDAVPVPTGKTWKVGHVFVYNGSAENFKVEIGVKYAGVFIPFSVTATLATLTPVLVSPAVRLKEGETLSVRGTGSTNGGALTFDYGAEECDAYGGGDA